MTVPLQVNKDDVFREVAQTTAYVGANINDSEAYDRMSTDDCDDSMLERFWNESKFTLTSKLKRVFQGESEIDKVYQIDLEVSNSYLNAFTEDMQKSMFSFFVSSIVSKWFKFVNKTEATDYAAEAENYLDDLARKAFFKKKPTRPTYSTILPTKQN